jgi:hypothetical protein
MYWLAGVGLALLQALSVFLIVRGIGALLRKRWRAGLSVLFGLAVSLLYVVLLGAFA